MNCTAPANNNTRLYCLCCIIDCRYLLLNCNFHNPFFNYWWRVRKILLYYIRSPFWTSFLVPAVLLSMLTHLFLSFSLSLSYSILAVPMRKCLGKHSCMSSYISYSHTGWYLFFSDSATTSAQCVFGGKN